MELYTHTVQYYETDKMGITHHSNYIRWMEEARIDFLAQLGYPYARLEEEGIISPVVSVACNYKVTTTFADQVTIQVMVREFKGIKLKLGYRMTNQAGAIVCEAESTHCFLNQEGKPLRLKKEKPEFYQVLSDLVCEG